MKITKIFMILLVVSGIFLMVSSSSMAENRFTIDKESIDNIVKKSLKGGKSMTTFPTGRSQLTTS